MLLYAPKPSPLKSLLRFPIKHKWVTLLLILACYQFFQGGYIYAKAMTAQWLIKDAWQHTLETGEQTPPWAWADTWPVAKLSLKGSELYVLAGASGRNLAFGPTHLSHTAKPGKPGNVAIAGHRDTHFRLLKDLQKGDSLILESVTGRHSYQVTDTRIVHENQVDLLNNQGHNQMTLITCYPFDGLRSDTELRYVVRGITAEQI